MTSPLLTEKKNHSNSNSLNKEINTGVPRDVLKNPALLFLYYRIEQILGIKAGSEPLEKLNSYLETHCGASFIEDPASYEYLLTSREQIFSIAKFLTVNETYFFRESAHFDLLAGIIPDMIKANSSISICSAATSIGCEAYSIAMFLDYLQNEGLDFNYSIDAFDVSAQAIETAQNARYTSNTIRADGLSWKHILDSYLQRDKDEYVIPQNIRRKVRFFTHNIMRGLDRQYDIIFFRNSLIYFSKKNRYQVINNLVESLKNNGLLLFGISETASAKHHSLSNRYLQNVFYFQKTGAVSLLEELPDNCIRKIDLDKFPGLKTLNQNETSFGLKGGSNAENVQKYINADNKKNSEANLDLKEISLILTNDEGKENAHNVLKMIHDNNIPDSLYASRFAAAAIYFLNSGDFKGSDKIISFLEEKASGCYAKFLRGEYYFLQGNLKEAEKYYQEAAVKERFFWPAFYRIQSLAAEGNPVRHEYKIKKTIESIKLFQDMQSGGHGYECFMGGFSHDYFRRILEKKLV